MFDFPTIFLIPYFVSLAFSMIIASHARRATLRGSYALMGLMIAQAVWTWGYIMELVSVSLTEKIFWDKLQWIPYFIASAACIAFSIQYTRRKWHLNMMVLWIPTLLFLPMLLLNICSDYLTAYLVPYQPFDVLTYTYSPLTIAVMVYSYLIAGIAVFQLIGYAWRATGIERSRSIVLTWGISITVVLSLTLSVLGITVLGQRDFAPISFLAGNVFIAWGFFRRRLFSIVPVARDIVLNSMTDAVAIIDAQGTLIEMNNRALSLATKSADYQGKLASDIFSQGIVSLVRTHLSRERVVETEVQGSQGIFLIISHPIYDQDKQLAGWLVIARDITQQREAEKTRIREHDLKIETERLKISLQKELELSQLKNRMMMRIGHEFRTPLSIIQVSSELIEHYGDRLSPQKKATKLQAIRQQVAHVTRLLDEINMVVNQDVIGNRLACNSLAVDQLLQTMIDDLQAQTNHPFILDFQTHALILGDQIALKQAFTKVVQNAMLYATVGSSITIKLTEVDQQVKIFVCNRGVGVLPNEQQRVFEPFFRGSNIGEIGGLGLGLTIAKTIIEAHGGTISIGTGAEENTCVWILLPMIEPPKGVVTREAG